MSSVVFTSEGSQNKEVDTRIGKASAFFYSNFWWRQLAAGRSLKFSPAGAILGEHSCPKECYGSSFSGRGSNTQLSNREADTLPLS